MVNDQTFVQTVAWLLDDQSREYSDREIASDLEVVAQRVEVDGAMETHRQLALDAEPTADQEA